jgi:hypothetical protein
MPASDGNDLRNSEASCWFFCWYVPVIQCHMPQLPILNVFLLFTLMRTFVVHFIFVLSLRRTFERNVLSSGARNLSNSSCCNEVPFNSKTAFSFSINGSTTLVDLGRFLSFLIYRQSVGLLGRGISPSQSRYLHTEKQAQNKRTQTSMPVFKRTKTVHALDCAATVIGIFILYIRILPFAYCVPPLILADKTAVPPTVKKILFFQEKLFFCNYLRIAQSVGYGLDCRGLIPGRDKRFFSSPQHRDRLWIPPSLLRNGYWGLLPRA